MNGKGFTLIELIVTVTIIGILSLVLGTSFQGSIAANRIEGQVKELHADLMTARARAMQRNRIYFAVVGAGSYQIWEDTDQDGVQDPAPADTPLFAVPKLFDDPVSAGAGTIVMNVTGIVTTPGTVQFDISRASSTPPDYDCIELTQTRIKMGQMNGGTCNVK
ncbi:MAG: hypothetical protein CO150_08520 [Nitrospirae bacterium CG_4_9_14_3_um_filter_53_35]|nr:MAG: hypothetical protein AUK29_06020 [Nitrospirae bacterium CG2_30_53_67]PIS36289.1 MAG: hypothetical protein COT35_11970 [Nitrospirae bacterium CG08_land_8_20_14_0_20_52_24]PIV82362.1 MAG: hypothetical protein COW52_14065 [Nitrospirae bacterium CG17_big_fil_post_rev_8_21_14_2_50_50_9]PIW85938.1 MAG: hypothetical protein COZ95_01885 [Nitrospirae bacterium CG_4_8_14_3_um_filter_50_41]PIX85512.1 MAG: hypothetical protein COZ32_08180 [Nitrospirae bacterium CG_4_10_14_3_um_filter_53_41]PJA7312